MAAAVISYARAAFVKKSTGSCYLRDKQNHLYVKNRTTGQTTFWKCKSFRSTLCKGKAVTIESDEDPDWVYIKSTSEHNHESSIADIRSIEAVEAAITTAKSQPLVPPRAVFGDITSQLDSSNNVLRTTQAAVTKKIQRRRKGSGNEAPPAPLNFKEAIVNMPEQLKLTKGGDPFLLYGGPKTTIQDDADFPDMESDDFPDDMKMMTIFMSPIGKEILLMSTCWFMDGTFKTAPEPFYQVRQYVLFHPLEFDQNPFTYKPPNLDIIIIL